MQYSSSVKLESRKNEFPRHRKYRMKHIDRQGVAAYIECNFQRLAMDELFQVCGDRKKTKGKHQYCYPSHA